MVVRRMRRLARRKGRAGIVIDGVVYGVVWGKWWIWGVVECLLWV